MPPLRPTTCARPRLALCLTVYAIVFASCLAEAAMAAPVAATVAQGQRVWQQRCTDCHALDTDETGPRHRGVFGRRAGSVPGYDYSRALRRSNVTWDAGSLDRWLSDPESFLPGQNMDFRLIKAADRAAVIAYLQSLSPPAAPVFKAPPAQSSRTAPGTPRR